MSDLYSSSNCTKKEPPFPLSKKFGSQMALYDILFIPPWKSEIRTFNLALRLSVLPENNSLNVIFFQIIFDRFKISLYIYFSYPMLFQSVNFHTVWVSIKMFSYRFIGSIFQSSTYFF